ncbi:hypothetical protein I656_01783 [Geobacillus sp. WSUCF1]|nr:hypothetical protein I656_01783 [Geobacillus sp. WSUCF1]
MMPILPQRPSLEPEGAVSRRLVHDIRRSCASSVVSL